MTNRGALAVLGLALLVGSVSGACGATDNGGALGPSRNPTGTTVAAGALRSRVPPAVAAKGEMRVGLEPAAPPYAAAANGGQPVGLDVELLQELGRELGVKVTFVAEPAAALGAGLAAHQLDVIAGGLADTAAARANGAQFVDYLRGGSAVVVRQGNPLHVGGVADLCGRRVGVVDPTAAAVTRLGGGCAARQRPVQVVGPLDPGSLARGFSEGQFDAVFEDSLMASYVAQASSPPVELAVLDGTSDPVLRGFGLLDAQLSSGLQAALQATIDAGAYLRILARWGAQGGALTAATTDGGT